MRRTDLGELETFVLAAREGSLAHAARLLGISTTGAVKRLDALEGRSGRRLLDRSPRGVRLTAAGRELYPIADAFVREANSFIDVVEGAAAATEPWPPRLPRPGVATLSDSEVLFGRLLHSTSAGIVISRPGDSRIYDVNEGFCRLLGYRREELMGAYASDLGMWAVAGERDAVIDALARGDEVVDLPVTLRTSRNEIRHVELSAQLLDLAGERRMLTTMRDVTDRVLAERRTAARAHQQQAVAELGLEAVRGTPLGTILERALQLATTELGGSFALVYTRSDEGAPLTRLASWAPAGIDPSALPTALDSAALDRLESAEPLIVDDIQRQSRFRSSTALRLGARSSIVSPIQGVEGPFGLLVVHAGDPGHFVRDDLFFLRSIANLLAVAIERERTKLAARALQEEIAESIPHVVWVADADGRTEYCNRHGLEYAGAAWDWKALVHPEDAEAALQGWRRSLRTGAPYEAEVRLRRHDGSYRWHSVRAMPLRGIDGAPCRWYGTCTDIERQRQAERRSAEALAILDTLQDSAPVAFVSIDHDLRFVHVNDAFVDLGGRAEADILGRTVAETFPDHWAEVEPILRRALEGEPTLDYLVGTADRMHPEVQRAYLASVFPQRADEEIRGVGVLVLDVTERRRLEEQLRQTQTLDAIGQLARGVAHDFNNLLTTILGQAQLLEGRLDEPLRQEVREIADTALRAAEITRQLLTFSRRPISDEAVLSLNGELRSLEGLVQRVVGERVELELDLGSEGPTVLMSAAQLQQTILNLAINARDAMPAGGRLTLATDTVELPPTHELVRGGLDAGSYAKLTVTDTGEGMDEATLARAFEPFFTTKPAGEGSGLGLATAWGAVANAGGRIAVSSERGRGTTFTLYLPCCGPAVETDAVPEPPAEASGGTDDATILVVEDERPILTLLERVLGDAGFTVLAAGDGDQAVEIAERHEGPIDLLLTDTVLPGPSGPELATRLRAARPELEIVLMSGHVAEVDQEHPFLPKPFTPDQLLARVRETLGHATR